MSAAGAERCIRTREFPHVTFLGLVMCEPSAWNRRAVISSQKGFNSGTIVPKYISPFTSRNCFSCSDVFKHLGCELQNGGQYRISG